MRKLIVLMHSMRSHITGEYQIMLDSNINIILHQLSTLEEGVEVTVTMPEDSNKMYITQFLNIVKNFKCSVNIHFLKYGKNAGHSRDIANDMVENINYTDYDEVENHFCTIEPRIANTRYVIFNSAVPDQYRPYAEKHFVTLLKRLDSKYKVILSCDNQKYFIPYKLRGHAKIRTRFFNPDLANKLMSTYCNYYLANQLDEVIPKNSLFFPFRVSDKCYKAEEVNKLGKTVVVTDPNDSADKVFTGNILDITSYDKCKKTLYMTMLFLLNNRPDIRIPLYEDITKNYHIGIVEMLYYCPDNIDFLYGNIDISSLKNSYINSMISQDVEK